ncbi:putative RNA methylase [Rhizobium leguminosarum]|uniref:Putative RNA methylase n=1 Tax=Rhizobium leguminosarum TaxID=384 RepID=A0A7Z0E198_RHILE|nr:putative RNA methylase [Rhizobium leguminosarum]
MTDAFGGSDAEGVWLWKDAYEACEVAQVLFLKTFGAAITARANNPQSAPSMLTRVARLVPTHTRRSDESQALQQLSTPMPLAYVAARAAGIRADDIVLEPSAGTGLLAIFAELGRARLALNEYAAVRRGVLEHLFPGASVTQHDAAHIDDYLDRSVRPTVIVMNPPFSVGVHVERRVADAAWRHVASAFAHPVTGAQSHLLTIERLDRNKPMMLADAQALAQQDPRAKLMVNGKSGRPAVMVSTRSIMLEDGSIQPRVSLIRPMDELRFEVRRLEETNWEEADEPAFIAAWNAEVAAVPEYSTSTFHIVSGLLLPIWRLLQQDYCRVYRLQTDEGERIVGRRMAPEDMTRLCRNFGIEQGLLLTPQQAWTSLIDGSSIVGLAGDMTLRRVKVMNDYRIELTGFSDGMRNWLKAAGLFSEMIAWKVRFFVPTSDEGPAILARLMQRHRLTGIARRS